MYRRPIVSAVPVVPIPASLSEGGGRGMCALARTNDGLFFRRRLQPTACDFCWRRFFWGGFFWGGEGVEPQTRGSNRRRRSRSRRVWRCHTRPKMRRNRRASRIQSRQRTRTASIAKAPSSRHFMGVPFHREAPVPGCLGNRDQEAEIGEEGSSVTSVKGSIQGKGFSKGSGFRGSRERGSAPGRD